MKLSIQNGVSCVGCFHVFGCERYGKVEIQVEAENGAGDEDDEDGKGGILKVGHLNLHGPKLDAPSSVLVGRGRFEAHVLPVGALKVLKVIGLGEIKLFEVFSKDDQWISDEEMGKMSGEEVIHSTMHESLLKILVHHQIWIHIFFP